MKKALRWTLIVIAATAVAGTAILAVYRQRTPAPTNLGQKPPETPDEGGFTPGADESAEFAAGSRYASPVVTVATTLAADFSTENIQNLAEMEKAYGFTFSGAEKRQLADRKFVVKNLLDTSIRPSSGGENIREFVQLYEQLQGPRDYHARAPENSMFFSADVFFHAYNNLYVELLKEMENKTFYPSMKSLSKTFYEGADAKAAASVATADKKKWIKVRDYFAVPYAIFSNAAQPLTESDYWRAGVMVDPVTVLADYKKRDAKIDTYETAADFIRKLGLGGESETAVLEDLRVIFKAEGKAVPAIFADEYAAYAQQEEIEFKIDFSQFTPRGTYTSSSLRRQYFRGMKWFIMVPFFVKSPALTTYAFGMTELMADHPEALKEYDKLESAIGFMVGTSDDLMPVDYLKALKAGIGAADPAAAAMDYLAKSRDPQIKDLAALYPDVGVVQSADVLMKTKGMRFFSGKFIIDSYWTGYLTQGDEALRPGYSQKLPPMASSLEVMTLLGSDYAESQIPKLDFYSPNNAKAIEQAMAELKAKNAELTDADWRRNLYFGWLWTIKGLFDWQKTNIAKLPLFMQSDDWAVKTLQTASAFWTELRHATILYAKQSFAELGAGGPGCDERQVPPPPKSYIEPQIEAFSRLRFLATQTNDGLKDLGFQLTNMTQLENFVALMDLVQKHVTMELEDKTLSESIAVQEGPDPDEPGKTCTQNLIATSDWETLRVGIIDGLTGSIPQPVEGPVLPAKDRRAALVADIHTGGDSGNPTRILYEGTGVPYVIFTAVKDANGARLTAGFISSHYEFTEPYGGQRKTDEEWQKNFYVGEDPYDAFQYVDTSAWPKPNAWYAPLFGSAK